jgi:hypothetical protein
MGEVKRSVLGRLLEEISWEGINVKRYRDGGSGYENVLTTEVFQALDFLPREMFLGEIVKGLEGTISDKLKTMIVKDIEIADFTLLPGNIYLRPSAVTHVDGIGVQPDGIIESDNVYCLLEAKRIKNGQFHSEQLAREFTIVTREAMGRQPLLILVLGENPPIKVKNHGRISVKESILMYLQSVLDKTEGHPYKFEQLADMIDSSVAWITWDQINQIVTRKFNSFTSDSQSTYGSISRLVVSITDSIARHRK